MLIKKSKRVRIFLLLGIVAVIGVLAILGTRLFQSHLPPILYISENLDSTISLAVLDPQALPCAQPRSLLDFDFGDLAYALWTPQRDRILYLEQGVTTSLLWIVQSDGSGRKQLTPPLSVEIEKKSIQSSRDQRYVTWLHNIIPVNVYQPSQVEAYLLDTQTWTSRQIMTETLAPAWSPIQNVLAIYRWSDGNLFLVQPDGIVLREYSNVLLDGDELRWSPDGQQIAFLSSLLPDGQVSRLTQLYSIDLQSGKVRQLTRSDGEYYYRLITSFSWSPDGKHISFVFDYAKLDGTKESDVLNLLDVDSGYEVRLADHIQWTIPVWSPDGKNIAFVSTKDGSNYGQIYIADIASRKLSQVTCYDGLKQSLSW